MLKVPCYRCSKSTGRKPGCHDKCGLYKRYKRNIDLIRKINREDRIRSYEDYKMKVRNNFRRVLY